MIKATLVLLLAFGPQARAVEDLTDEVDNALSDRASQIECLESTDLDGATLAKAAKKTAGWWELQQSSAGGSTAGPYNGRFMDDGRGWINGKGYEDTGAGFRREPRDYKKFPLGTFGRDKTAKMSIGVEASGGRFKGKTLPCQEYRDKTARPALPMRPRSSPLVRSTAKAPFVLAGQFTQSLPGIVVLLIGMIVGSGISFAVLRSRFTVSFYSREPFFAAQ
jgi:hypothetical protein